MKKFSLFLALGLVFGVVAISFGAEFQGHKWGANVKETSEILTNRYLNHKGTMGPPRTDTSKQANYDMMFLGRWYVNYTDDIYGRRATISFVFDSEDPQRNVLSFHLSRVLIIWMGDLYDYVCQCVQKEFGKPIKSGNDRGIRFKGWERGKNNLANVVVGYDGRTTSLSYYGPNYVEKER